MLDGAFDQEVARSLAAKGGLGNRGTDRWADRARERSGRPRRFENGERGEHRSGGNDGACPGANDRTRPRRDRASTRTRSAATIEPSASLVAGRGGDQLPFGMRADPFTGEPRFHAGVDGGGAARHRDPGGGRR
jgi:hypothetical protein